MKQKAARFGFVRQSSSHVIIACIALLFSGYSVVMAQQETQPQEATPAESAAPAEAAPKIPNDQLDSLVAPIALYPDPLLAQVLAASTYPLEIIQLQQWLPQHKGLKDKALVEALEKRRLGPQRASDGATTRCGQATCRKRQLDH